MVAEVTTFAFEGVDAVPVKVQAQKTGGPNAIMIVGLPDKAVSEARERVRAAFSAIGLGLPPDRITVNLAPADLPKEGSHFDLPIAISVMMEIGAISKDLAQGFAIMGELGLDGSILPSTGALPAAIGASALDLGLICPSQNGPEAAWAGESVQVIAPNSLIQLINHFKGTHVLTASEAGTIEAKQDAPDLKEVKGQESAKRALEIAAAGGHNMLMLGPPGSGKSMLAARLPSLLPTLSTKEMLEISMVQSMAGLLDGGELSNTRPFRAPHHSASMAAMVGGGAKVKPGEASLAHRGVLFLDELPEFSPQVLDSLRQPLETGDVIIARANAHVKFPAQFQLIAAMNPCRCGYGKASGRACGRGPNCEQQYQSRVSGPFLDRMDLTVEMPPVTALDMAAPATGETSSIVATRIQKARLLQKSRLSDLQSDNTLINANLPPTLLERFSEPDDQGKSLLVRAAESLSLSARAYTRILRVSRTIADLEGEECVKRHHIAEAISYRQKTIDTKPANVFINN